jgi:HK97 family phage prohead protease
MADDLRADAPREDLIRMLPAGKAELRAEDTDDDGMGTLFGYASVFNEDTTIDSWEGRFVERIAPGAFRKTLRERADQIKVLFNHGMDPQIGDKPLGRATVIREDEHGLYVEVPLSDTSYNRDIRNLLKDKALDGMSFRMSVTKDEWTQPADDEALPTRTIKEVRLYEFGPVTFPAYAATQAGVRAHAPEAFEAFRSAKNLPPTPTPGDKESDEPTDKVTRSETTDEPPAGHSTTTTYTPAQRPQDTRTPDERAADRRAVIARARAAVA